MTLLSLLISLFLDRVLHIHREGRLACALRCYAAQAANALPSSWTGVAAVVFVVAPPVIAIGVIQWALAYWLFGVAYLVLAVVVLLWSLGPVDVADLSEDYVDASRAADPERIAWYYRELTGEAQPTDPSEEARQAARVVLYQAHDNIFATIFWFCVLGPAGAVLYRLAAQVALVPGEGVAASYQRSARFVCGVLGWIPTRLIAASYALTGRFGQALSAMRRRSDTNEDWLEHNRQLLGDVGTAALREREPDDSDGDDEAGRRNTDRAVVVQAARSLATRAGVLWLAIIAVLTLMGWFV